jgi:lysophospholipase L1-like esterase
MAQKAVRVLAWVGSLLLLDAVAPRPGPLAAMAPLLPGRVVVPLRDLAGLPAPRPPAGHAARPGDDDEKVENVENAESIENVENVENAEHVVDPVVDGAPRRADHAPAVEHDAGVARAPGAGIVPDDAGSVVATGTDGDAVRAAGGDGADDASAALDGGAAAGAAAVGAAVVTAAAPTIPAAVTTTTTATTSAATTSAAATNAATTNAATTNAATTNAATTSAATTSAATTSAATTSAAVRAAAIPDAVAGPIDGGSDGADGADAADAGVRVASIPRAVVADGGVPAGEAAAPGAAETRRLSATGDERGFEFPADTHTWDRFVEKVRAIQGGPPRRTRIVHLGDSEIAGDRFVSTLRADVAARVGLGGPGFALVSPPWHWYRRAGFASLSSTGFVHRSFVFAKGNAGNFGPGGVAFDAVDGEARADVRLEPAVVGGPCAVALLYAPQPGGGELEVFADDAPLGRVSLDGGGPVAAWRHSATTCPKTFSARVRRLPARLFGWSVESGERGVVWTSLGIVGANASALSRYAPGHLGAALAQLEPDLVVASYGLNLTGHGAPVPRSEGEQLVRLMAEIRATRPDTACLVMSPYPVLVEADGALAPSETTKRLARVQRAAAQAAGCVFLDRERLVGGPAVALEWLNQKPRYLSGDYVHLTPAGASFVSRKVSRLLLGELFGG